MAEEKLYRVQTKEGAHINERLKDDGSRAAIQFDSENGLQGPVDLIEVSKSEYTREVYVEVEGRGRSLGQVIIEDAVAPAVADALTIILIRAAEAGVDAFGNWIYQSVLPAARAKGSELIDRALESREAKKKGRRAKELTAETAAIQPTCGLSEATGEESGTVVHTPEEVDQIVSNMRFAALYIAAGIRELSNTAIADDGGNPDAKIAMEAKLRELSTEDVTNTIDFMLSVGNRDVLDKATVQLFEAFRHNDLIIEGKTVPISQYLPAMPEG